MNKKARNVVLGMVLGVVLVGLFLLTQSLCVTSWLRYGISSHLCPDGRPRQTLSGSASSLRRGTTGWVNVSANAHFTTDRADHAFQAPVTSRVQASAFLVHADGKEEPLPPSKKGWQSSGSQRSAEVSLRSDLKDGDYRLRFKVKSPLAEQSLDVPLPVYAPARIHVLTDRPLYEAGHTVRFRAVALRAKDLAPLDGRPGIWTVTDPTGEVLLEERSPAGAWGVSSGSFPLDSGAETGDWKVRWVSGDAQGEASFTVKPFTLPRFRVEASASKAFYRPHEKPVVRGSVTYSSGAPVAGAEVALTWQVLGNWPAPYEWQNGALPTRAQADKAGRFTFDLPQIPGDLRGQVTLAAALSATDPAGDRVEGSLSVLLAQEGIQVSTVTEIGDGLVQGFNNRLYLRVTDPGGVVLPKADLVVKRAWDPSDKGVTATTDEDGVASLQIDPGPAVNVVIPAMPYRPKPRPRPVSLQMAEDLLTGDEPGLADRKVLDGWLDAIAPCGRFVEGSGSDVTLGVRADAAGAILAVGTDAQPLSRCVAQVLKEKRLAAGPERLLHLRFGLLPPALPEISTTFSSVPDEPEGLEQAVREAVLDSRPCLPKNLNEDLDFDRFATWKTTKGSKQVTFSWAREGKDEGARLRTDACVDAKFRELTLAEPAEQSGVGIIRFRAVPYYEPGETRPQATTMLGYEFLVTAKAAGEEVGSARLRVNPGVVPPIRLRMTPVLVKAGEKLKLEILRGPQFQGELPEKLYFQNEGHSYEVKTETDRRSATFTVPAKAQGWFQVSWGGAQTMAFVRPETTLSVSVRAEREHYAPGQTAKLLLETRAGEKGTAAAVTLSGVDESLSQLVPLPGGDELAKLRTHATMTSSAFGSLDAQALAMGRIRGANAAAAVVLRVASPPPAQEIDNYVNASSSTLFTPLEDLTDHFYTVLGELYTQTRRWEETAPAAEKMKPKTMAQLWNKALDACEKRGEAVGDAYGRRLRLSWLPQDLLGLVEPRVVVVQAATRLPEDVENWQAWVAKEKP